MEEIKKISESVKEAVPADFRWVKDERLNTVLVELEGEAIEKILEKLIEIFENQLDPSSIMEASKQEMNLVNSMFGLSSGQFLFTSNYEEKIFFGAWWPWGNGSKVSLRVGIYPIGDDAISADKAMKILTELFPV